MEINDITNTLLDNFDRRQVVKKYYRKENGTWAIHNCDYIADWDSIKKETILTSCRDILANKKGCMPGVYDQETLAAFAVLLYGRFGTEKQYAELKYLHVSFPYRHRGIGKKLFTMCAEKAKEAGIRKMYISANSAEESQRFYLTMGCKDAREINETAAWNEPYDRQMEYEIYQ